MTRSRAVAALSATLLAACSSSTEPADAALNVSDARRAAAVFSRVSINVNEQFNPQVTDPSARVCPKGGSIRIVVVNAAPRTLRLGTILTDCAAADSSGQVWTFNTLPRLDVTETTTTSDSTITTLGTTTGALRVESASVRGSCRIETVQSTVMKFTQPTSIRARFSGQVCGQVVDTSFTAPL